ncbi:peptide ABC transporter substrate-binding protein [Thermanaerothrix sp.]|jgi:peptide/nickel transport system substrate-binding protein|uniref:ABC transporter substrate-binding protein n=1 Tax=Thermanaerothrix sp. TaxID=2972675 RepID=UPI002ADD7284|nr:peptide ABC transporter substrate-binding protein [Thermanaerothrix sp.]
MKNFRWQLLIIFLTGLVVGILLLSERPNPVSSPQTPEPRRGGAYTEALIGHFNRLNPLLDFYNPADRDVDRLLYSALLRFDERGLPQADLAESWGISQDGTVYNFTLRSGTKWHDGQPLTSADVVFTIEKLREGGSAIPADLQEFWKAVEVKALSDTALQFRLPEPFAPFLDYLTFGIVPQHLLEGKSFDEIVNADFNLQPVGSGPYRFERLIVENGAITGVVLSANADYYIHPPYIEQIVFRYYPDSATALQAFREGQVQGISQITPDVLAEALAEPNLALFTARRPELSLILFNLKNADVPFFQDAKVRRALYTAINRQYLADRILQGQAILADGPIFPGTWAYYEGTPRVNYNPDEAQNLLREAGYTLPAEGEPIRANKDGVALRFTLLYPDTPQHRALAEAIQADWAQLNIDVQLEAVPYDVLVQQRLAERTYQAALVDLNLSRSPDPDPYPFWDQVQATGGQNYTQWDHKLASEYLEKARITPDIGERTRLYRNFQVIFAEELPALPLFYPVYNYGISRQVQGVRIGPLFDTADRFATILEWHLLAARPQRMESTLSPTAP